MEVYVMWTNEMGSGDAITHRHVFSTVEQAHSTVIARDGLHHNDMDGYCPSPIYKAGVFGEWKHLYGDMPCKSSTQEIDRMWDTVNWPPVDRTHLIDWSEVGWEPLLDEDTYGFVDSTGISKDEMCWLNDMGYFLVGISGPRPGLYRGTYGGKSADVRIGGGGIRGRYYPIAKTPITNTEIAADPSGEYLLVKIGSAGTTYPNYGIFRHAGARVTGMYRAECRRARFEYQARASARQWVEIGVPQGDPEYETWRRIREIVINAQEVRRKENGSFKNLKRSLENVGY